MSDLTRFLIAICICIAAFLFAREPKR